jgi:acyl-CoA thioesterase
MHVFDQAMALERIERNERGQVFVGQALPAFTNLIGPFGGWSAGILGQAMLMSAGEGMELVSITTDFLAGVPEGAVRIETNCDRAGRNTEFWSAKLLGQDGSVLGTRASGVLSRRRDTAEWTAQTAPESPEPEACPRLNLPMEWARTLEIRLAHNRPFRSEGHTGDMKSTAWVRIDPLRQLDVTAMVALADTPTPRLFFEIDQPETISTVSMTVYVHATAEDFAAAGNDYLLLETDGARGHRGFYDQHARIWSRDGRMLATTQQIVWYKSAAAAVSQTR